MFYQVFLTICTLPWWGYLHGSCNVVEDSSTVICIHHSGWNELWVCFKVITICRWIPQYHANTTSFSNNCALQYTCSDTPCTSNYLSFHFCWVKSAIEAQVAAIIFHIGNLHQIHSITNNTQKTTSTSHCSIANINKKLIWVSRSANVELFWDHYFKFSWFIIRIKKALEGSWFQSSLEWIAL